MIPLLSTGIRGFFLVSPSFTLHIQQATGSIKSEFHYLSSPPYTLHFIVTVPTQVSFTSGLDHCNSFPLGPPISLPFPQSTTSIIFLKCKSNVNPQLSNLLMTSCDVQDKSQTTEYDVQRQPIMTLLLPIFSHLPLISFIFYAHPYQNSHSSPEPSFSFMLKDFYLCHSLCNSASILSSNSTLKHHLWTPPTPNQVDRSTLMCDT